MDNLKEYKALYEQFYKKSNEELETIINSGDDYTEIAKQVAKDVLSSTGRHSYLESIKNKENINSENKASSEDVLLNISNDIHSIKNMLLFFVILTALGIIAGLYTVFVGIDRIRKYH